MEQKEKELEETCRALARKNGWVCWKNEKNGCKGIPDDSFLHGKYGFFMVEFKKDDKQKPRKEQKFWLNRFPNVCFLIGNFSDFVQILERKMKISPLKK